MKSATLAAMLLASIAFCTSISLSGAALPLQLHFRDSPLSRIEDASGKGRVTLPSPTLGEHARRGVWTPSQHDFDLFVIQQPTPNFGDSWYMVIC